MPGRRTPYGTHSDNRAQLFDERQRKRHGRKNRLVCRMGSDRYKIPAAVPNGFFVHDEAILGKVHQLWAVARSRCHASKHFLLDMASFAAACPRIAVMRMGAFLKHQVRGVRFLPTFLSLVVVVKNLRPSSKKASAKRKRGPVAALDVPQIETRSNFFSTCLCDASI